MPHGGGYQKSLAEFGELLLPDEAMEPILARPVREALTAWLTEIWSADELAEVGLKPRSKAMFSGPPGVGKTTLAHHLAARLGLPMVAVRADRLLDTWLGSSARNIGALFDLAAAVEDRHVLFIDEFDGLAVKRRAATHGAEDERNSWVNTLLQQIEKFDGFLIAATNRASEIDEAVWRRFDMQISLALPEQFERERILIRYLEPYTLPDNSVQLLAESLATSSPALIRQFCEAMKRNIVIGPKAGWNMQREAVVERIVSSISPHPDLGKPRLWSHGAKDVAIRWLPWPLTRKDGQEAAA